MNGELQSLIKGYMDYAKEGDYYESTRRILQMNPTAGDFSDDLFDSFEPKERVRIYQLLSLWCKDQVWAIFDRRTTSETDTGCRDFLQKMSYLKKVT